MSFFLFYDLLKKKNMYHTISNIDNTINLQQYIDNRDGNKRVGLKSFSYALGWYNVVNEYVQKTKERPYHIQCYQYTVVN
jgi:hypothetical protein